MNKEEMIEHWKPIVQAVLTAEHNIVDKWEDKLKWAKNQPPEIIIKVADEYVSDIAREIVDKGYSK